MVVPDGNGDIVITNVSKLNQQIAALYLSEKFSDVIFNIEGQKLHAHKVILAARSEYFENLLFDENSISQTEITINNVSPRVFRVLLKYIYSGIVTLTPSNTDLILEVLALAHQYAFTELEEVISQKLKTAINLNNFCVIMNAANHYDFDDLKEACHTFADKHASEIVESDCFNELTESSLIKLLERDTFFIPELKLFKLVATWCKINNSREESVLKCVRLSLLTVVEIVSVVWPSKLFDNEDLLGAIAEIVDVRPKKVSCRGRLLPDVNVAGLDQKAEVITGYNSNFLLTGNRNVEKCANHVIGDENGITVKLPTPIVINHIHMMLWDSDLRYYCYYIQVSVDQENWKTVIDYKAHHCRSYQSLYFNQEVAQYIRVIGTHNSVNTGFHLVFFEAYHKTDVPKYYINGISRPNANIATLDKKAIVIEGTRPEALLDGNTTNYDGSNGYTSHTISSGSITVQLAQPYLISSMKLLLWDGDSRSYKYYIETSVNKTDWKIAVDRRNEECKSWQLLKFEERPVVYVRITGTHNTSHAVFHCVHFECPATEQE